MLIMVAYYCSGSLCRQLACFSRRGLYKFMYTVNTSPTENSKMHLESMTIECKTVRGRWKAEEHDWERTGGLIWWKIHSGRENQKESKSREASLAMSCMYRGLVRKRERKHWATSKKDCVFAAHIHKHETESCTAFPLCLSWPSSPSSSLCLSVVLFFFFSRNTLLSTLMVFKQIATRV